MRSCTMHPRCQGFIFLLEGARQGMWVFAFLFWVKGTIMSLFFFLFWVMSGFFVLWHILCFCFVHKVVVWMFKSSSILLTYAGESHGEILFFSLTWVNHMEKFFFFPLNIRVKLLFSFSLHGSCGGPKRVLFFSLVTWIDVEVQKEFCSFHLSHG